MRILILAIAVLSAGLPSAALAQSEDLASQVDAVASLVNAQDTEQLGGPSDAEGIVSGLDGQWFPLNNIVRNWGEAGVGYDAEAVDRSIARHCSSETQDATFYEVTRTDGFSVREKLGAYGAEFVQDLSSIAGRRFSISFDDEALVRSYGKQDASDSERGEILAMAAKLKEQELEFWRPSNDILISHGPFGLDVTGRCAAP